MSVRKTTKGSIFFVILKYVVNDFSNFKILRVRFWIEKTRRKFRRTSQTIVSQIQEILKQLETMYI